MPVGASLRAPFSSTKAALKLNILLDLRGAIPSFIHISDGKRHDPNVPDLFIPEPANTKKARSAGAGASSGFRVAAVTTRLLLTMTPSERKQVSRVNWANVPEWASR